MDRVTKFQALLHDPLVWAFAFLCLLLLLGYYYISARIGAMHMPTPQDSAEYREKFVFWNRFAANLDRAATAIHLPHEGKDDHDAS